MNLLPIPKQPCTKLPDTGAIKIQHLSFYLAVQAPVTGKQITEAVIADLLEQIPKGINVYLSLDPNGEENWMEVLCDGTWLALGSVSYTHLLSGKASEYFLPAPEIPAGPAPAEYQARKHQLSKAAVPK